MNLHCKIAASFLLLSLFCFNVKSQIIWPEGQILPTFPASAQTQDLIYLQSNVTGEEKLLFASMKGIVNLTQPRIFSYEGDAYAEGQYTWLNSLGVKYVENTTTPWNILGKYLSEFSGLIVYDTAQIHTANLASALAKEKKALLAGPSLVARLTSPPFNLPILEDFRGKFKSKLEVYQTLYDTYWPNLDHRLLIGLNPGPHKASLREYAVALGVAVIWLDVKNSGESALLNKFLSSMPQGANYMGWWPEEAPGVERASTYGIPTIASDFCTNLTFHSGMPRTIEPKPMLAKPELQNKIYVAFILSDGDNLQYIEHLMRKLWNNSDRGSVPIGWTISPAMVDAMPGALNYYHKTSTDNDNLISGPSGYGYAYPNKWNSYDNLIPFVSKTEEYNVRAGIRVITVWNTITGGIDYGVGRVFSTYSPTLLGLTAQNTGGALSIYPSTGQSLPGMPLSCNYCDGEKTMKEHITSASSGWDGKSPRFLIIQAQPWTNVTPTTFKNVKNSLGSNYVVVRPDQIFQLIRESKSLTINPGGIEGDGTGLTGIYYSEKNFETEANTKIDTNINFSWGKNSPATGVNANNFSVRWTGQVQPRYTGTYTFYITSDNTSRLWIDDQLIIDKNVISSGTYKGTISLVAGKKYDIKTEYVSGVNLASCKLEWASPFQSREVIPSSHLYAASSSGIKDVNIFSDLNVFPDSSKNGILNIEMNNYRNEDVNLTVYDTYGNALLKNEIKAAKSQLDVSKLSKGIYMISVRSNDCAKTIKHIIN